MNSRHAEKSSLFQDNFLHHGWDSHLPHAIFLDSKFNGSHLARLPARMGYIPVSLIQQVQLELHKSAWVQCSCEKSRDQTLRTCPLSLRFSREQNDVSLSCMRQSHCTLSLCWISSQWKYVCLLADLSHSIYSFGTQKRNTHFSCKAQLITLGLCSWYSKAILDTYPDISQVGCPFWVSILSNHV